MAHKIYNIVGTKYLEYPISSGTPQPRFVLKCRRGKIYWKDLWNSYWDEVFPVGYGRNE